MMPSHKKSKKVYIEFLRVLAIFFVIFNHTGTDGFFLFSLYPDNSIRFWLYLFVTVFCKFAVPMFFAISGALLLSKKESIGFICKKRVLKMLAVLVLFSFIYYVRKVQTNANAVFSLSMFFRHLYHASTSSHLWYLYAYISFLLSLPLLRPFVQNLKKEHFYYLFFWGLFFLAILPILEYLLWQGAFTLYSQSQLTWLTTNYILYPCLGYFLEHKIDILKAKKLILPLWIINILTIFASCFMTYYKARITGVCNSSSSQTFLSSFVLINVATLYITVKYLFATHALPQRITRVVCSAGTATFGIYLLHIMLMNLPFVQNLGSLLRDTLHVNFMLSAFIVCLVALIISWIVTLILKKIPVLKQLL